MPAIPSNHHFVPKCYLKEFTDFKKSFFQLSRNGNKLIPRTPTQVCYEKDYFNISSKTFREVYNIEDETYIEKEGFKYQENNYNKHLKPFLRFSQYPFPVSFKNLKTVLETVVTIKRRNPTFKEQLTNQMIKASHDKSSIKQLENFLIRNVGLTQDAVKSNEIQEFIKNHWKNFREDGAKQNDLYLTGFLTKELIDDVVSFLISHKVFILHSLIGTNFITSDNPGFTKCGNEILNFGGFGGYFEYFFPLTPNHCLYVTSDIKDEVNEVKQMYPRIIDKAEVRNINENTAAIAQKKIFAQSKDELLILKSNGF